MKRFKQITADLYDASKSEKLAHDLALITEKGEDICAVDITQLRSKVLRDRHAKMCKPEPKHWSNTKKKLKDTPIQRAAKRAGMQTKARKGLYNQKQHDFKDYLIEDILNEGRKEIQAQIISAGKAAGLEKHSNLARVYNPKGMKNGDFVKLIKQTFEVDDVVVLAPKDQGNPSSSFYTFLWNENQITLAGAVKGRGSRQTEEQEISWLLVLSGYHQGYGELVDDEFLEKLSGEAKVYSKITNSKGKFLGESDAQGLVFWLSNNNDWLQSHRKQANKFIKSVSSAPLRYVKDYSKLDIVQHAKALFPKAVPGQIFDKDKWNPADVWLYYEDLTEQASLADLNNYLLASIEGGKGIIGISLKLGGGNVNTINARKRPVYVVDDFDMKFGDLFAQNVNTEYGGMGMEGYSVMYRLFSPKIGELIRGEAQQKAALAAQGKVYLKYIDHLTGGAQASKAVAGVAKKIVEKDKKTGVYKFTTDGARTFNKVKRAWPLVRDNNIIEWASTANPANYDRLVDSKTFLEYVNEYAIKKKLRESEMQVRVMARFQTIMLGLVFSSIKRKNVDRLHEIVLGMLLFAKSESTWSAPHMKAQ